MSFGCYLWTLHGEKKTSRVHHPGKRKLHHWSAPLHVPGFQLVAQSSCHGFHEIDPELLRMQAALNDGHHAHARLKYF